MPSPRRSLIALASLTAALGLSFAAVAAAAPTTAHAAVSLTYSSGYSVQGTWLCYGWSSGTYHCTQHWYTTNGRYVSTNTAWVPNVGSTGGAATTGDEWDATRDADDPGYGVTQSSAPAQANPPAPAPAASSGSVQGMIQSVFGAYAGQALRVSACESGYNPNAYNASSGASGVFQFLGSTWATTAYAGYSPFNAWANVNAAHQVFVRDGYSWREWTCQP